MLYVDGGPSTTGKAGHLRMHGREVFRHAVTRMAEAIEISLKANNLTTEDIDWVVPHQANIRIMDSMAKKLALKPEQIVVTVDKQANTSAATIPLALAEADGDGRLRKNQLVSLTAMGGGFTWGSALLRW
jgi:3-oxoacyl-[acyl-carrier-protein] synthase-3